MATDIVYIYRDKCKTPKKKYMKDNSHIGFELNQNCCRWEWDACNEEARIYMAEHPKPNKTYQFSTFDYDFIEGRFEEKELHDVPLTDEQYEYLLTQELYGCRYNFNDLLCDNPTFARELLKSIGDGIFTPNTILFDEVYADARQIRNQCPAFHTVYKKKNKRGLLDEVVEIKMNRAHEAFIVRRIFSGWGTRDWRCVRTQTEGIDGKHLRKLFGGASEKEMIANIRERFHKSTAYDDLMSYLKLHQVKMSEPVEYEDLN